MAAQWKLNPKTNKYEFMQDFDTGLAGNEFNLFSNNDPSTGQVAPGTPTPLSGVEQFGIGAQALTGLAGAYNAYKQMGLQKNQFDFNRSLANRNIANAALTTNKQLENQAAVASQLLSGADYGTATQQAEQERLYRPVSGAPV